MNEKIHPSDLEQVYELLFPARSNWYDLGCALKINTDTLDDIEKNNPNNVEICLRKMLKICLDTNTSLTWSDLENTKLHLLKPPPQFLVRSGVKGQSNIFLTCYLI